MTVVEETDPRLELVPLRRGDDDLDAGARAEQRE